ncbi:DUF1289 domain-containing protein [Pseudomonas stutzeri]|nr:DUF1289 domain-containing protein [Stutzerimonas stutzeri]
MANPHLKTPCVGRCSTVYDRPGLPGCKRFDHEVVDWSRYDEQAKKAVLGYLAQAPRLRSHDLRPITWQRRE